MARGGGVIPVPVTRGVASSVRGVEAPSSFCVMARDRLADLLRDLCRAVGSRSPNRIASCGQRAQADKLGELGDRLQRVAATGTEILGVTGDRRLAPDARATAQALEMGHHVTCAERVGATTPGGST